MTRKSKARRIGDPHRERARRKKIGRQFKRIRKLESKLLRMSKGKSSASTAPDCPPELRESHLEDILAFESLSSGPSLFEGLQDRGVDLPDPADLDEWESAEKIVQILEALARIQVFITGLAHLGPREAYAKLYRETLWEGCYVQKKTPGAMTVMDASHRMSGDEISKFFDALSQPQRTVH